MESLGPTELIIIMQIVVLALLPLIAWVYMYRQNAQARDLIFWGVIALAIPLLGPIAAMLYIRWQGKPKRQFVDEGG